MNAPAHVETTTCDHCGSAFYYRPGKLYCSEKCRDLQAKRSPRTLLANRVRNRAWCQANRNVRNRNAWLIGAPPFGDYLPGGAFKIKFEPHLRWPLLLRNSRLLHGAVTALTGPHDPSVPKFSLLPHGEGWGVFVADTQLARSLAGKLHKTAIADQEIELVAGPLWRFKSPKIPKRGRSRIRIDTLSPVVIRSSGETRVEPTAGNLKSTLSAWLPRRIGIEIGDDDLRLEILEKRTKTSYVDMGGKYGTASGFSGHLILEVNAVAWWLLESAARGYGLGGKTAFGFGRIVVSHVDTSA